MIRIQVNKADAFLKEKETLTSGRVGLECAFTFSEEWAGLGKTATFVAGNTSKKVVITNNKVEIPWECLQYAGVNLRVGIYGTNGDDDDLIVIPTIWCGIDMIMSGADSTSGAGTDPTSSQVDQILAAAAQATAAIIDNVTVDTTNAGNVGAPSVTVTDTTVSGERTVNFTFSNLKGATGATGPAGTTNWSDLTGKPSTFPPSTHTHAWSAITDKPSTFTPSSHSHVMEDITDLPSIPNSADEITYGTSTVADALTSQSEAIANKQDKLTAGANITITNNVISATGGGSTANDITYDSSTTYSDGTVGKAVNSLQTETGEIREDIDELAYNGILPIRGNDHHYYFGGGSNKQIYLANAMTTRVFPIDSGKKYSLVIDGNAKTIGFANEEFTTSGVLLDSKVLDDYSYEFTNETGYKYFYVYCSQQNNTGRCTLISYTNLLLKTELAEYKEEVNSIIYDESAIVLDKTTCEKGYLYPNGKGFDYSDNYYHTDYIEVEQMRNVTVKNFCISANYVMHFFDKDKNAVINIAKTDESNPILSRTYYIPPTTKYMRFTFKTDQFDTVSVFYTDLETKDYISNKVIKNWFDDSYEKIGKIFAKATKKPICCIIDDDTQSVSNVNTFINLCDTNGIKGTFACLTSTLASTKDALLSAERQGYQVILHGYNQISAYQNLTDSTQFALAEDDFVHGIHDMKSSGFANPNFWATPYGVTNEKAQSLAKKWGMECLIGVTSNEYETTEAKYGRFALRRCGLNPTDSGSMTQAQLLSLATQCANENGWLLICTHVYDWGNDFTRFNDFVTHCKGIGYEFMTLGEAWEIRKPIYDWYDTF